MTLAGVTLRQAKIQSQVIVTEELARDTTRAANANLAQSLSTSVARGVDVNFLDPGYSPVTDGRPGAITHNITPSHSSGTSAANFVSDLKALLARFIANGSDLSTVVLVLNPSTALWASQLLTAGGTPQFPELGATGGAIWKVPTYTSIGCAPSGSPGEHMVVGIDLAKILLSDDGRIAADISRQASVQMSDTPSDGPANQVSLWQNNLAAVRLTRWISWERADDSAVEVLDGLAN
jgi:hypothetical protein